MLLLAVDTSGRNGTIALARGHDDGTCTVIETIGLDGGAFSAQLVPQIGSLLEKNGFEIKHVGGFAAVSGPGSFTGLRVGLAAIKAFGEALARPIAAVSLLAAVAIAGDFQGEVLAALDAGRGQIYVGAYEVSVCGARRINECLVTRDQFLKLNNKASVVTPDCDIAALAEAAGFGIQIAPRPRADSIAKLGWAKILSGEIVSPEALEANYTGYADAEIFSKSK